MNPFVAAVATWMVFVLSPGCGPSPVMGPDVIIHNGHLWSDGEDLPATAIALQGDTILALGSDEEMLALATQSTHIIDARQRSVLPGFIDSHVHFLTGGYNLKSVQLRNADTPEAFVASIAEHARRVPRGSWILGGDWNHELWGGQLPTRQWIDSITPDHPVFINRLDGHMALANGKALAMAGLEESAPNLSGGEVVTDERGRPTGIFKDNAMALIDEIIPAPDLEEALAVLDTATKYVWSHGVTSVHHMGTMADLNVFQTAHQQDRLGLRIYAATPLAQWSALAQKIEKEGRGDHMLKWGGLKGFVDGSLGSHTAYFWDPYTDQPEDVGLLVNREQDLEQWIRDATSANLQVMVHAIGDRANSLLLDIYAEETSRKPDQDHRFRIEHAQHLTKSDISRMGALSVIPSMQPYHAIDDGCWAEKVIGSERIQTTYAFNSLVDAGTSLAFGSDWFVAPPFPLAGLYAATTRRTLDGANPQGWVPEERIELSEALLAYTTGAAYAEFAEGVKGSLKPGFLADIVILDKDIFVSELIELESTVVDYTILGGQIVYRKDD